MNATIQNLSVEEKLQLIDVLWDSIAKDPSQLPLPEAHQSVINERLAAYKRDGNKGRPVEDVLEDIQQSL